MFVKKLKQQLTGNPAPTGSDTADLKGKQLALGRAKKAEEALRLTLADAREQFARSGLLLGEAIADGIDSTVANRAMIDAENHVRQTESALAVLTRRREEAASALKQAEDHAATLASLAAFNDLFQVATRIDENLAVLTTLTEQLALAIDAYRATGNHSAAVADLPSHLRNQVILACRRLISEGAGMVPFLGEMGFASRVDACRWTITHRRTRS